MTTEALATTHQQLATAHDTRPNPFALASFEAVEKMATYISDAKMYGITSPAKAVTLLMMAYEEKLTIVQLMRQIHVMEDGKIAQRADWTQAEFEKVGIILWHTRNDEAACATFFLKKTLDDADIERAAKRCELLRELDDMKWTDPRDVAKERKVEAAIAKLARPGEETVLRTLQNMDSKGTSIGKGDVRKANWATSAESMLQWRVVTAGVKVVAPGVLNGMPSQIELQDAINYERQEKARIQNTTTITEGDVAPILAMIEQYDAELATDIPDGRRKNLQGLRQDLVCKLADLGVKPPAPPEAPQPTVGGMPATVVETVVLPPEKTETTSKPPATRKPRPAAQPAATTPADDVDTTPRTETQSMDTPWIDFICLRGQSPGPFHGKTLGHIFTEGSFAPKTSAMLDKLVAAFVKQSIPTSSDTHDKVLWAKVQEADKELRATFAPGSTAAPTSTQTTPAAEKPAQQPASPTRWQDFVIPGRHPDFAGKTLGSLGAEGVKRLQDEYLIQIEWPKATLPQKSLKAQVALAVADLFPKDIPPAESEPAFDHTKMLRDLIATNGWDEGFFVTTCKLNTWIAEARRKVEDITPDEFQGLEEGWPTVETEMAKAHQPAQQP